MLRRNFFATIPCFAIASNVFGNTEVGNYKKLPEIEFGDNGHPVNQRRFLLENTKSAITNEELDDFAEKYGVKFPDINLDEYEVYSYGLFYSNNWIYKQRVLFKGEIAIRLMKYLQLSSYNLCLYTTKYSQFFDLPLSYDHAFAC